MKANSITGILGTLALKKEMFIYSHDSDGSCFFCRGGYLSPPDVMIELGVGTCEKSFHNPIAVVNTDQETLAATPCQRDVKTSVDSQA